MILDFAQLQKISHRKTKRAVAAWARAQGIPCLRDADGLPFTTLDAINRRLEKGKRDENQPRWSAPAKRGVLQKRRTAPSAQEQVEVAVP